MEEGTGNQTTDDHAGLLLLRCELPAGPELPATTAAKQPKNCQGEQPQHLVKATGMLFL